MVPPAAGRWKGWDPVGFILTPPPEFHPPHLNIARQILGRHVIKGGNDNSIRVVSEAKEPDLGLDLSDLIYLILSDLLTVYKTPASGSLPLHDGEKSRTTIKIK